MVTPHVPPADDYPRQPDGAIVPTESEVGLDYGEDARRRTLEEGSGVGQMAARLATVRETCSSPNRPSDTQPEQLALPIPPKRRRRQYTGGRSLVDGPSGRDVSRMLAEAEPGPDMTPRERRAAAAKGVALARQLLAGVKPAGGQAETSAKPVWVAPAGTDRRMARVFSDRRTAFLPTTLGELSYAERIFERLNPKSDQNSVDSFLAAERGTFSRLPSLADKTEAERLDTADGMIVEQLEKYGGYTKDAAQKLLALKGLADAAYEQDDATMPVMKLIAVSQTDIRPGLLALVQHDALREVKATNTSSTGVDLFLNLGAKFDEVAALICAGEPTTKTKLQQVIAYVDEVLSTMTVGEVRGRMQTSRLIEMRRYNFWSRIFRSVQGEYRERAEAILDSVWQA